MDLEFLRSLFADGAALTFDQFAAAVQSWNAAHPGAEQINPVNLAAGGYVAAEDHVPKADFDTLQTKYNTDTATLRLDAAIGEELYKSGARNPKLLRAALDMTKVELKDGKLTGLSDQLKTLRSSDAYLFADAGGTSGTSSGGSHGSPPDTGDGVEAAFFARNPELKSN